MSKELVHEEPASLSGGDLVRVTVYCQVALYFSTISQAPDAAERQEHKDKQAFLMKAYDELDRRLATTKPEGA